MADIYEDKELIGKLCDRIAAVCRQPHDNNGGLRHPYHEHR